MYPSYPTAPDEYQERWLALELQQTLEARADAGSLFAERRTVIEGRHLRHLTKTAEDSGTEFDQVSFERSMAGVDSMLANNRMDFEYARWLVLHYVESKLDEDRARVPSDPNRGHRPVRVGRSDDGPSLALGGVVCLDCDWTWVGEQPDYGDVARRHRAAHLDPPAWSLCENHPWPRWFWANASAVRDLRRRGRSDFHPDGDVWPVPAVGVYYGPFDRQSVDIWRACRVCADRARIVDFEGYGAPQGHAFLGRLIAPGGPHPGNAPFAAPYNSPGAELDFEHTRQKEG